MWELAGKVASSGRDLLGYLGINDDIFQSLTVDAQRAIDEIYQWLVRWDSKDKCEYFVPMNDDDVKTIVNNYAYRIWDSNGNPYLYVDNEDDDFDDYLDDNWVKVTYNYYINKTNELGREKGLILTVQNPVSYLGTGYYVRTDADCTVDGRMVEAPVFCEFIPNVGSYLNCSYYINNDNYVYMRNLLHKDLVRS